MKKIITMIIIVFMAIGLNAQTATQPSGSGSQADPYRIASLENLYWISSNFINWLMGYYFIQTADIDASASSSWDSGAGWTPMGDASYAFNGHYDGQGYEISNLYINRSTTNYVGFFGMITSAVTIERVGLVDVNITGAESTGGLIGTSSSVTVDNCYVTGSVNGTMYTGGLIGRANNGTTIQESYSSASVTNTSYAGGLAGYCKATINNSYTNGNITSSSGYAGGIAGILQNQTLTNCYSSCVVTGLNFMYAGGVVGLNGDAPTYENQGYASKCFYNGDSTIIGVNGGYAPIDVTGLTTAQMQTKTTFTSAGWDFINIWRANPTHLNGFPYVNAIAPDPVLPITLENFDATYNKGKVNITWVTESEENNARFLIYRNDEVIAMIDGAGTTTEPHDYSYTDADVVPGMTYIYKLADVSYANELVVHEEFAVTLTISENDLPQTFALNANYPNPFNPTTAISYQLTADSKVRLSIYDMNGKLVRTMVNQNMTAGYHEVIWDGKNNAGIDVNSGMYISRLVAGDKSDSRKMLMVK